VDELSRTLHSYHTVRLRLPTLDGVNVRFLGRFANATSTRKHFERSATGSTRYTLSLGDFRSAPVRWPPIEEQRAISDVLDILDTTIRQTEAIIAKLRQVKQGLLHDLLTRGIDANGELRPPQSEAPHLYKQSPLGWIPKNWSTTAIGDIAEIVTGSTPPSSDALAWGQDMPFITPADVLDDRPIRGTERYVSSRGIRYVRRLPPKTTIVVCIGSTIGKVGLTASDACSNQQINAVIPSEDVIADYLYVAIKVNIGQLRGMAGLQAVPIVNKSSFSGMLIPVAPMDEQRLIAERLASVSLRINAEEEVRAKLLEQKSGLMDDLLTGRIRVTPLLEAAATP
jgi:type I restriction enzyme S subunit